MDLAHLDWPFFESRHRGIASEFRHWAAENLARFDDEEGGDGRVARQIFELLGRDGWLRHSTQVDNSRFDLRTICLMREIAGFRSAMADVALSEPWLGVLPIALAANHEFGTEVLAKYNSGELLPAFALSEPHAGSDASAIRTNAKLVNGHYEIFGQKKWTSNVGLADLYVVFARADEGISAYAIPGRDPGISIDLRLSVMPPHTVGVWSLNGCRAPIENLIGQPGSGMNIALAALEIFRPTVAAAAVGFARRALSEAKEYCSTRTAFKKPIAEHQLVQAKLADMAVKIDAAALLTYRAAWLYDAGKGITREAAIAKYFATEASFEVVDQAVQLFGGMGVTKGSTVERLFRHVRAFRIFDGTSEIQQLIIARDLLKASTIESI